MPRLINPESIYPKRMGIYRGAVVLEYFDAERDCFKKHLIPFDGSCSPQSCVEAILEIPKHAVFLRKVAPQHLKAVISGDRVNVHREPDHTKKQQSLANEPIDLGRDASARQWQTNDSPKNTEIPKQIQTHKMSYDIEQSQGYSMNFDEQLSMSIAQKQQPTQDIQQDFHEYSEDFQDFEELLQEPSVQPQLQIQSKSQSLNEQLIMQEFEFLDQPPKKKQKKEKKQKKQKKEKKVKKPKKVKDDVPVEQQFDFI